MKEILYLAALTVAAIGLLIAAVLGALEPEPRQPTPPGQTSPECTKADLADGSCYTWQDFHDSEWRTD